MSILSALQTLLNENLLRGRTDTFFNTKRITDTVEHVI